MPDPATNDSDLLGAWLKSRDEKAFHALVERYAVLVHQAARRVCHDDALAADASQATFITLVKKARSLASRPSLAGWLHVTAVLQTRNLLRQRQRESRKHQLLRSHMDLHSQETPSATWNRLQPHLDEALATLSDKDRETLLLRFYRSLSVSEIASTLGIATAAAQKRLDRATERLRLQLTRQGCTVGSGLGTAIAAGFAADAEAALIPASATLASHAIAAGTATTSTLTTLGIIVMTKKSAMIAGAAVLLVGAGVVAVSTQKSTTPPAETAAKLPERPAPGATSGTGLSATEEASEKSKVRKDREASRNAELIAQYGESRTNLSRKIAGDVVGLLEDAVAMGEIATSPDGAKPFGGPENGLRRSLGNDTMEQLQLTDEQKAKAADAYLAYQKRKLEETKGTIEDLKKDPDSLMQLFLAGDAYKRGDLSEDQYKQYQQENASNLEKIVNPLDRKNFQGGEPLKDTAFQADMNAILDPTQKETFGTAVSADAAKATAANETDISNIPVMELEKLDQTITSARKMTSGIKQMMEGMGGLQDLGPMIENQRKAREGQ